MHSGLDRHDQQYQDGNQIERDVGVGFVGYDSACNRADDACYADYGFIGCNIF